MTKYNRVSHILQAYLEGELEVDTAVAELTHAFLERGWRFSLVEADCAPMYRARMHILAARVETASRESAAISARVKPSGRTRSLSPHPRRA